MDVNIVKTRQQSLSEQLRLLQALGFSDLNMADSSAVFSNKDNREPEVHRDIRVLDVIALCLATGDADNVVAATITKDKGGLTLVLAKNGEVGQADKTRVEAFLAALRNATSWVDMLPFLTKYGIDILDKRISRLHDSVDHADDINEAAETYTFSSMEEEFPKSEEYRRLKDPRGLWTPKHMVSHLLEFCAKELDSFKMQDLKRSHARYVNLFRAADILRRSAFLTSLTFITDITDDENSMAFNALKLKRRLGKICQFARLDKLIPLVKKQGKTGLQYYWIKSTLQGTGEGKRKFEAAPQAVVARAWKNVQEAQPSVQGPGLLNIHRNFDNIWGKSDINPRVHAELRIIICLSGPLLSGVHQRDRAQQRPIGCSKRSCLCCMLWMESFNRTSGLTWMTSGTHGKPYDNWALPGYAGRLNTVPRSHENDSYVIDGVRQRLLKNLRTLLQKRPRSNSDENASSGSDENASSGSKKGGSEGQLPFYEQWARTS